MRLLIKQVQIILTDIGNFLAAIANISCSC